MEIVEIMETTTRELPLMAEMEGKTIHCTRDYDLFTTIDGNRKLIKDHVKKLKLSMKLQYLFTIIIVNENNEIIDGQHRFEVIKELNLPMYYVVCPGYGINEVHRLNQNSKTWTFNDYMEAYCTLNDQTYKDFKAFRDEYRFKNRSAICIAIGTTNFMDAEKLFREGSFQIDSWDEAHERAKLIQKIGEYFVDYRNREFIGTILTLFRKDEFDINVFIEKLKLQPTALKRCSLQSQYLLLIEDIYNYRSKEKVNLRY